VIKQLTDCDSPADSWELKGWPDYLADVLKRAVALVIEQQPWFEVFRSGFRGIHLRINMAVYHEQIEPAGIVKVEKRVSPANIRSCAWCNSRSVRNVGKTQAPIVPE